MSPWLLLAAVAVAQESAEGPPLAIPAEEPAPPEPERAEVVVPERPLAIPGRPPDLAEAHAIREYRSRYLALRTLSGAWVGTSWDYSYGWHGPGWVAWPHPFVVRHEEQAIFQGPQRIDVPQTLGVLGDTAGKQQLERRIRKNRTVAGVLYGLGVAGIAGSVVGVVGMDRAQTYDELATWSAVSWGSVGVLVGGFVGGSFPGARAWRLQLEPDATFDTAELQRRIQDYNEQLAAELGLDPVDAARLEGPPR